MEENNEYDLGHVEGWDACKEHIRNLILGDPALGSAELIEMLDDENFGTVEIINKRKNLTNE